MGERDVLTQEELDLVCYYRSWFTGGGQTGQPCDGRLLATISRLVSEVERLRAQGEKLEKVAKAAASIKCAGPVDYADRVRLYFALSALAEPGKGGAT